MALDTDIIFSHQELDLLRMMGCAFTRRVERNAIHFAPAADRRFVARIDLAEFNRRQRRLIESLKRFTRNRRAGRRAA